MVARDFPWVELIRRGNIGFAAGNNLVLRGSGAEFVLLLNPDTELRDGTLESCLERMDADPAIGIVGCKLVLPVGGARSRLQALISDAVVRPRPFHGHRPLRSGPRPFEPISRD